ncbi:MAG: cell division protein FtsA [Bdellovibrionota bacterium]
MAAKSETIVGLDIGTNSITVVIGETASDGQVSIIGIGTAPSKGLRKGVVINIEATVKSIAEAISKAETMAGREIQNVFASISGSHISGFNSHGIVGIKHREVSHSDIERVIEAAKAVAIPLDREVLHVLPQEFIIDEQDGIKEPLGISGVRLESRVHIVTGSVASAQNVVKCANRCGLTVRDIVLSPLAAGKAAVTDEEKELGVALIDVGGGTTDITVFHLGAVKHTSVISVGGSHITNDIAAGLRTPISSAEEIKCLHGFAATSQVKAEDTIDVPSTGGREARVLSKVALAEIIEPRVVEIFKLAHRELVRSGTDELLISGIVLTGGTANLSGICKTAEEVFGIPVRVGSPLNISGIKDIVAHPEYSAAVGLVLYGAESEAASGSRAGRFAVARTLKKVSGWFSEHF